MPKRPRSGSLNSEAHVAEHVREERERRGWSTAELAQRVTDAGCPINQSAIWRIESGEPRRRISVDELIAFSKVFDLSIERLLGPTGDTFGIYLIKQAVATLRVAEEERLLADRAEGRAIEDLIVAVWGFPELEAMVPSILRQDFEAAHIADEYPKVFEHFQSRMEETRKAGAPAHAPGALEILREAHQNGNGDEGADEMARFWGRMGDLERLRDSGVVYVVNRSGKPEKMPLTDYLNSGREDGVEGTLLPPEWFKGPEAVESASHAEEEGPGS